ncbi:MAG: hypothetical protein ACP5N9_04915 [Candidatus Bilamarchaeum sp.]|jgi:hypothetical protein
MAPKVTKAKKISEETKKNWLRIRAAWSRNLVAFNNSISMLNKKETEEMYNIAKLAAYSIDYARLVFENPQLKEILKNSEDCFMLNNIYQALSFKLNRKEKLPATTRIYNGFAAGIGRFGQK